MNKAKVLKLAKTLAECEKLKKGITRKGIKNPVGFNMAVYHGKTYLEMPDHVNNCKTVACLAGWTLVMENRPFKKNINNMAALIHDEAAEILGLDEDQADELFTPNTEMRYEEITPKIAIKTLRNLAKTGEVVWDLP